MTKMQQSQRYYTLMSSHEKQDYKSICTEIRVVSELMHQQTSKNIPGHIQSQKELLLGCTFLSG